MQRLSALPVQDGGRVMPLDTYARHLASQVTGRERWSAAKGPEAFAGRHHMQFFCDLAFKGHTLIHKPMVQIDSVPFKQRVGLSESQKFFSPVQIGGTKGIEELLVAHSQAKQADPGHQATREQRIALELQSDLELISNLVEGQPIPFVSTGPGKAFGRVGVRTSDPGLEAASAAWAALGRAYVAGSGEDAAADAFISAVKAASLPDADASNAVKFELAYNRYQPWLLTAYGYGAAIILLGLSRLTLRKPLVILTAVAATFGVAMHLGGITLRVLVLGRAPVSNTYEALLWMGLVGLLCAAIAQFVNRKAWYFAAGLIVAELSVIFANLVPLESQTNSLPAVLRSNFWLIVHVLTITASYGVLAVASILSHVYLVKEVLLARPSAGPVSRLAHPLIAQTYRSMQLGLVLLTAGTILGGVWAADSWGRFWGWDPKETWALISIVVYFIILHARYLHWLEDFGTAVWGVLSFASIVWTFYGVNYLMAAGLHSYGFGSGGGLWVAVWVGAELLFVGFCLARRRPAPAAAPSAPAPMSPPQIPVTT